MRNPTDAEEAAIQNQIASDADATEATGAELVQAKTCAAAFPDLMESMRHAGGRPAIAYPR